MDARLKDYLEANYAGVFDHLRLQYEGIFDEERIERHIREYVDVHNSLAFVQDLIAEGYGGKRLLDIGSGYGSNVLAARQAGIDAIGIDIEPFEVEFARNRLRAERPDDSAEEVYILGSGLTLPFEDQTFDLVTIMNVLEHVHDYRKLLHEAVRVLRPGGMLYALCPNYAAFRQEAHYHVPWLPFFHKGLASIYLKLIGRNPRFLQTSIHYCTNWGILSCLSGLPVRVENPDLAKICNIQALCNEKIRKALLALKRLHLLWGAELLIYVLFYSPFKPSVYLRAVRKVSV